MGGPCSEKLWPKSLKWEGSIFKFESQFFTIHKDPKAANKLFTFSSFLHIVSVFVAHFHKQPLCVTVTVGKSVPRYEPTRLRDWLPFPLRKKVISGIIYYFWTKLVLQFLGDFHAIASASLNRRSKINNRWTIYSYAYYLTWGFRRILKREELTSLLLSHQANSMKCN